MGYVLLGVVLGRKLALGHSFSQITAVSSALVLGGVFLFCFLSHLSPTQWPWLGKTRDLGLPLILHLESKRNHQLTEATEAVRTVTLTAAAAAVTEVVAMAEATEEVVTVVVTVEEAAAVLVLVVTACPTLAPASRSRTLVS